MAFDKIQTGITTKKQPFEKLFRERFQSSLGELSNLYNKIYAYHPDSKAGFEKILETIEQAFTERSSDLKERDFTNLDSRLSTTIDENTIEEKLKTVLSIFSDVELNSLAL